MTEALSKAYNDISTFALRNARTTPRISTKRTKRTIQSVFSFAYDAWSTCGAVGILPTWTRGAGLTLIRLCEHAHFTITARGRAHHKHIAHKRLSFDVWLRSGHSHLPRCVAPQLVELRSKADAHRQLPHLHQKKSKGLIQKYWTFFSLHIGSSFLSVSKHQSLVGVFNRTFSRLFFLIYNNYGTKALSTGRKFFRYTVGECIEKNVKFVI